MNPAVEPDILAAGGTWEDTGFDRAHVHQNLLTAAAWPAHPDWPRKFLELLGTRIVH